MEKFKDLVPVEWSNQLVLTTAQLAEAYNCSVDQIKKNFSNNKNHYKEGLHYFKIAGELLEELRVNFLHLQISPMTRTLYLWTYQGCVRHCKSINTPEAWKMFDELEENYFNRKTSAPAIPAASKKKALKNPRRRAGQLKDSHVYVALLSDNTVKIGNANDVEERIKQIEIKTNLKVLNHHYSPLMSRKNARLMEIYCQKIFSPYKTDGEFFSVKFEAACNAIDIIAKIFDACFDFERAEKLLQIAGTLKTLSENQVVEKALLIQSSKLIVDSKID